jgi:hypothetical protein
MAQKSDVAEERHLFRSLIKLAVFVGLIYAAGRFITQKKDEYAGLTESQARTKFVDKVGPKLGEDTAKEIADQVIPKLKEKGLIKDDPEDAAGSDPVAEAVDSVVED